jgi:hypothetical protein
MAGENWVDDKITAYRLKKETVQNFLAATFNGDASDYGVTVWARLIEFS